MERIDFEEYLLIHEVSESENPFVKLLQNSTEGQKSRLPFQVPNVALKHAV